MKTLSFRDYQVGRARDRRLLRLDTEKQGVRFDSGIHLIVAPNGRGKTTLLQTIAGVLPMLGGEALLGQAQLRPGTDVLYVSEYLSFPKFIYPGEWIEYMCGKSFSAVQGELERWIDALRLRTQLRSYLGRMSQGERRKTTWLAAHASSQPVVLLDEPLDGLDLLAIGAAREMVRSWKAFGRIVCIVAHQVGELVDLSDEVWLIRDGALVRWTDVFAGVERAPGVPPEEFRERVLGFYSQ